MEDYARVIAIDFSVICECWLVIYLQSFPFFVANSYVEGSRTWPQGNGAPHFPFMAHQLG